MERGLYEDQEMFREVAVQFNPWEVAPHYSPWGHAHMMARKPWNAAGEQGLLGLAVPEELPLPTVACRPCATPSAGISTN